jgi:hypothetical protein
MFSLVSASGGFSVKITVGVMFGFSIDFGIMLQLGTSLDLLAACFMLVSVLVYFLALMWRQHVSSLEHWLTFIRLHDVIF